MRVLHVFPVSEVGGAENVSLNLMRYRERPGIEHCAVLVADEEGTLGQELTRIGVPWERVPRGRMRSPRALWQACLGLRRVARESRASVLLANSAQGFLYARLATVGLGLSAALYYMAVPRPRLWNNNVLDVLMALARPSAVFTASRAIGEIVSGWGVPNVLPVHHGTPVQSMPPDALLQVEIALWRRGVEQNDPVIVLPGRLQPWKGQQVLIEAWPEVLKAFPNAHAVLLGGTLFGMDSDYPQRLQRLIDNLSLARNVHLVGHQEIFGWFERATIVVHASTEPDPFPNVCIEAMAARKPLITNALSGTCEILRNGIDGMIVPPNDPQTLAMTIVALLRDPARAARLAESGFDRYQTTCTPLHMVRPIEATLSDLWRGAMSGGVKA